MLRIKETHVNAVKVTYNRGYSDRVESGRGFRTLAAHDWKIVRMLEARWIRDADSV